MTIPAAEPPSNTAATFDTYGLSLEVETVASTIDQDETTPTRVQIIERLPELATHQWQDTYFDGTEHDIIAVFDYATETIRNGSMCIFMFLGIFFLPLTAFLWFIVYEVISAESIGLSVTLILFSLFWTWIVIGGMYRSCKGTVKMPHTAVTTQGVLQVSSLSITYLFPFNEIIDADGGVLKLVNGLSSYEVVASGRKSSRTSHLVEIAIGPLLNPTLFQALIRIMKERNRDARHDAHSRASDIEMATLNDPQAPPSKEALRAMYEKLKRENDLLEVAMKREEATTM